MKKVDYSEINKKKTLTERLATRKDLDYALKEFYDRVMGALAPAKKESAEKE